MRLYSKLGAKYYDYYQSSILDDVNFYVEEAKKSGSPVLELGCGTGRIAIPIAEAGIEILGLDIASDMIAIANEKAEKLDVTVRERLKFIEGDMTNFQLARKLKLIIIPFRAFQHLMTIGDQKKALHVIREHLEDNGRLIINLFDPSIKMIAEHESSLGRGIKYMSEFTLPENGHKVICMHIPRFNIVEQTLDEYFTFEELDETGKVVSKDYVDFQARYVFRFEMEHLFGLCGFQVESLFSSFQRDEFVAGKEQIWIVKKLFK